MKNGKTFTITLDSNWNPSQVVNLSDPTLVKDAEFLAFLMKNFIKNGTGKDRIYNIIETITNKLEKSMGEIVIMDVSEYEKLKEKCIR